MAAALKTFLADALWLAGPMGRARAQPAPLAEALRLRYGAARARLHAAADLREARSVPAAGAVHREALRLAAVTWLLAARGEDTLDLAPEALWARAAEALPAGASPALRARWELAGQALLDADPLALDRLPAPDALARVDALAEAAALLLDGVEVRTPRRLWAARALRVGLLVSLLVGALGGALALALRPVNVALGQPVTASGYWPGSAPAELLVDGVVQSPWASATARNREGWFAVDLGRERRLQRVEVVNRQDKTWRETVPLLLELSSDGVTWTEVTRFTGGGALGERWVWRAAGHTARHVRLRKTDKQFALSEIEVFARR